MLVLSRRQGESIVIGQHIRVTIERIGRGRVCVGIEAPRNIDVDRREVWLRKRSTARLSASDTAD